jgi:hypothetical protein
MLETISNNMLGDISNFKFTPEEKEMEHSRGREVRANINSMNISNWEKEHKKDEWFYFLLTYDNEYKKLQKL